ncbi:hypothetical protein [Chryseobacterium sp. MYb328]|uniref:hypothetical protein n=1 Tax=Chryseobacterium sp. MYb328 TaxID=2745231 RepID=UPI0030960B03
MKQLNSTGYNKVLSKAGLNGFDWALVHNSTFVLRLNFCAKNPHLRQYLTRYSITPLRKVSRLCAKKIIQSQETSIFGMFSTTDCIIIAVKIAEITMPMGGGMPGMM